MASFVSPQPHADPERVQVTETGSGLFQAEARANGWSFLIDEPLSYGGLGSGPTPYDVLGAALAACTTMTLRLFANRKNIPLIRVAVSVGHTRGNVESRDRFDRAIKLVGDLDDEQRASLLRAANRCPVHATLNRGADIFTELHDAIGEDGDQSHDLHMSHMIESCSRTEATEQ